MSFDHALGEWIVVGTMTVSENGLTVVSDPGVGIRAPGWHGMQDGVLYGPPPPPPPISDRCKACAEKASKDMKRATRDFALTMVGCAAAALIPGGKPAARLCTALAIAHYLFKINDIMEDFQACCKNMLQNGRSPSPNRPAAALAQQPPFDPIASEIGQIVAQAANLATPFVFSGIDIPDNVQMQIDDLFEQTDEIAGGDAQKFVSDYRLSLEQQLRAVDATDSSFPFDRVSFF